MSDEQLWTDDDIGEYIHNVTTSLPTRGSNYVHSEDAEAMGQKIRDDLTAERAKLMQRIETLEQERATASSNAKHYADLSLELEQQLAEREAYEVVDTIETEWGYQLACVTEHPDGEITLQTTGYSIADPDQQFSIRMPKQYRLCRKQSEASDE
jgi:hypothetical protein